MEINQEKIKKDSENHHCSINCSAINCPLIELEIIEKNLEQFQLHFKRRDHQKQSFFEMKHSLIESQALLVMDFKENLKLDMEKNEHQEISITVHKEFYLVQS